MDAYRGHVRSDQFENSLAHFQIVKLKMIKFNVMKRYTSMVAWKYSRLLLLAVFLLFPSLLSFGQTTVFNDNFNRTATSPASPGGTPNMTYTTIVSYWTGAALNSFISASGTLQLSVSGGFSSGSGTPYM